MVKRMHAFHPVGQATGNSASYSEEPEANNTYQTYASTTYEGQNPAAFNAPYTAATTTQTSNSYYAPAESYGNPHYDQTHIPNAASPTSPLIYGAAGAQSVQSQPFQSQNWQNHAWQSQTSPTTTHRQPTTTSWWSAFGTGGYADEPSLLEELGINFAHIKSKTMSSINPFRRLDAGSLADADMSGPLLFCFLFGASLLLTGKVHFGYIYGVATLGWLSIYALLSLMAEAGAGFYAVGSVLGYCLLPMVALSALAILLKLQYPVSIEPAHRFANVFRGILGFVLGACSVLWCTTSSSTIFVAALGMKNQQVLIAYPIMLFYSCFALMTIF